MKTTLSRSALAAFLVLVAACQAPGPTLEDPARREQFILARYSEPVSFDPARTVSSEDGAIIGLLYRRLTRLDPETGQAVPDLAESWTTAADGLSWTFTLKPGVRFESGAVVDANSVKYSVDRLRAVSPAIAQLTAFLKSVTVEAPDRVRFDLAYPFPPLAQGLSLALFAIVDPAIEAKAVKGDHGSAWMSENSAGTGPYRIASWSRGDRLDLAANPAFVGERAFPRVQFRNVPDPASQRLQLQRGNIDLITDVPPRDAAEFEGAEGIRLKRQAVQNQVMFLTMNTETVPLAMRRAIALAIDYDGVVDEVLMGNAQRIAGPVPAALPGYRSLLQLPRQDIAAARAELAKVPPAERRKLVFMAFSGGPLVQLIQANLAEIGIETEIKRVSPTAVDQARSAGEFDLFIDGVSVDFPDPSAILNPSFSQDTIGKGGLNFSRYRDPGLAAELQAAAIESDPARRMARYAEVEARIMAGQPVVPLYSPIRVMAFRDRIAELPINPFQPSALDIAAIRRNDVGAK